MRKQILISLAILLSAIAYCQSGSTDQNFQKGKKAFKSEKYQEALAYLSISIVENPTPQAYHYRSMAFKSLGDSCNSCRDLKTAALFDSKEFQTLFEQQCTNTTIVRTIPAAIKHMYPNVSKLKIVHSTCDPDSLVYGIVGQEQPMTEIKISFTENGSIDTTDHNIYTIVEEMPSFPGGEKARDRFLAEKINYPERARNAGIQGTIYLQFIIDRSGSVKDVKVLRGIGGGCDEEAVRVITMMPKWIPGKQNGKTVNVKFDMPIYFKLGR